MQATIRVIGYRELLRATDHAERAVKREVRGTFREVGEILRVPWSATEQKFGSRTADGLRVRVRQRGVSVEQSMRKTTGKRPDFGRLQQRIGTQVLSHKEGEVTEAFEHALDRVADIFDA